MLKDLFHLYAERWHFFLNLTIQHLEISLIAIVIAIIIGLGLGILISRYRHLCSPVLGLTNFIYTIPTIALFGFLIPFSGIGNFTAIIALTVSLPGKHRSSPRDGQYFRTNTFPDTTPSGFPGYPFRTPQYGRDDHCINRYCSFYRCRRTWDSHLPGHHHQQRGINHCRQFADCPAGFIDRLPHRTI